MIKIRAHHLLCIPRFYSGGYNKEFAENMKKICLKIRKNPNTKIKIIVGKTDDLCSKCPHRKGNRCRQPEELEKWIIKEDKKIAKFFKIKPNSVHKARDIFNLSMEKAGNKEVKNICERCPFMENCLKVGINNSFRKDLNKELR